MNLYGRLVVFIFLLSPGIVFGHSGGVPAIFVLGFAIIHILNMVAYYRFLKRKYSLISLLIKHRALFAIVGAIFMPVASALFIYLIEINILPWFSQKNVLSMGASFAGPIFVWVTSIVYFYYAKD